MEREDFPISSKVMVTVDPLYVNGLIDEKVCGEGEQGAGHFALSHVESDQEKAANSHAMGTGTLSTWEILLRMRSQTCVHVSTASMEEGNSADGRLGGRCLPSKAVESSKRKKHRVNKSVASSGQAR